MLVRRAGLYALGIVTSVAVGAGASRLLWPRERVADVPEQLDQAPGDVELASDTPAEAAVTAPEADVEVDEAADPPPEPPADRAEAPGPPPGDHFAWIKGYWSWDEQQHDYTWVAGLWYDRAALAPAAPPRPLHERVRRSPSSSYAYAPGSWRWTGQRYVWIHGHYARRHPGLVFVAPHWVKVHGRWAWRPGAWVSEREIALARERARLAEAHRDPAHPRREPEREPAPVAAVAGERTWLAESRPDHARQDERAAPTTGDFAARRDADPSPVAEQLELARQEQEAKLGEREAAEARNQAARDARATAREHERDAERVAEQLLLRERQARAEAARERRVGQFEHVREHVDTREHQGGDAHEHTEPPEHEHESAKPKVEPREAPKPKVELHEAPRPKIEPHVAPKPGVASRPSKSR